MGPGTLRHNSHVSSVRAENNARHTSKDSLGFDICKFDDYKSGHLLRDQATLHSQNHQHQHSKQRLEDSCSKQDMSATGHTIHKSESFSVLSPRPSPYHLDYRNAKHYNTHWSTCAAKHCMLHYGKKKQAGHFPHTSTTCADKWYACTDDICATHLWEKRERLHFPGHFDPTEFLAKQNGSAVACGHSHWQLCLSQGCIAHAASKTFHGFGATSKKADGHSHTWSL